MPPLPRTTCPECGLSVPLRVDGELREHRPGGRDAAPCVLSGRTLAEIEAARAPDPAPISERADYDGDAWSTPDEIIAAAREVLGGDIDLDPATNPAAQRRILAARHYTREDDGLSKRWAGRVWLNPPYSWPLVEQFSERLVAGYEAGDVRAGLLLVNSATSAAWFQRLLARFPACFLAGRVSFLYEGEPKAGNRNGQALFYLGPDRARFAAVFGVVVEPAGGER